MLRILRYLQIIVTVLGLTACVLLIALWVRSANAFDSFNRTSDTGHLEVWSCHGKVFINWGAVKTFLPVGDTARRQRLRNAIEQTQAAEIKSFREVFTKWGLSPIPETSFFGFKWSDWNSLVIPFWFPVALTVSMAAIPWIHWSRRFSLRTLLIGMSLVAVALGMAMI